ncbi:MAG TPA: flavodoxin domain-containing protein [Burkholderiales bacterium]|nr:flavodoxin domain-containing protein [Burkholderiales bacterium]
MQQLLQMQALQLTILVGTMTGTAQLVAQELELTLEDADTAVKVLPMDGLGASVFSSQCLFLICSSTYGQGDVPDNARALYESLRSARPELSRVRYGVIALGDRTYADTFCNGGRRFDAILSELGAKRIGDILLHDASAGTMPEEVAAGWAPGWLALCREKLREAA